MKIYFSIIAICLLFCSCENTETQKEVFPLPTTEYTILPFSQNDYYIFKNVKETTLSDKELILIEELFQKMRTENNSELAKSLINHNKKYPEDQRAKSG